MRNLLLLLAVVSCATSLSADHIWQPSIEPRGITNGYRQGVGVELLLPVRQNECSLLFTQGLAGRFQDEWVGALGLGYRRLFSSCCLAWGVNGFVDGAQADRVTFGQGGVGLELLGPCWEGRINGYFPFNRVKELEHSSTITMGLDGRALFQATSGRCLRERAYMGFDVEGGYGRDICWGSFWGYAGYYYFSTTALETIQGPRLRLVYRYDGLLSSCASQLIAGLLYEYDQVHGNRVGVEIGIRIPLGHLAKSACCSPSSLLRRMGNRIVRQEGILRGCERQVLASNPTPVLASDGTPREVFFVRGNGTGKGTQSSPMALADAIQAGGRGAIFVLSSSGGDIHTNGITLSEEQSLLGFGEWGDAYLDVEGLALRLVDKSGRAALVGPGKGTVVTLTQDNTIRGIRVEGGQIGVQCGERSSIEKGHIARCTQDGVQVKGASDVTLDQVTFSHIGDWLIAAENAPHLTACHIVATDKVDNGIKIAASDKILLDDLKLELGGDVGLQITASSEPTIRHVVIDGGVSTHKLDYGVALKATSGAHLERITLHGIDGYAILAQQSTSTTLDHIEAQTKADEGIRVVGGENFTMRHSTVTGAKGSLVNLQRPFGSLTLTDNTFGDSQSARHSAVEFVTDSATETTLTFSRNKLRHSEGGGVKIEAKNGSLIDLILTQNTFTSLGGQGLLCIQNGSRSYINGAVSHNTLTDVKGGIALRTGSYAAEASFDVRVSDNTLEQIGGTGILVVHEAFSKGVANLNATLSHNTINGVSGPAIHLFSDLSKGPDHTFSALVQANTIQRAAGEAIRADVEKDSGGNAIFKFIGNRDLGGGVAVPYSVAVGPHHVGQSVLTMGGNSSDRGAIHLSGPLEVEDLDSRP